MKKNLLLLALLITSSVIFAQNKTNKLDLGMGLGMGAYLGDYESTVLNAYISVEADYFFSNAVSLFGNIDYNRSFSPSSKSSGSFGFATSHIGPRFHFAKIMFLGVGAGASFFTDSYGSSWTFSYLPQLGVTVGKTQLVASYNVLTSEGYSTKILEVGAVFKLK